jgi:hypothetical protein
VTVYADPSGNLYIIANSLKEMRGVIGGAIAEMDDVIYLPFPYQDEKLENALYDAFERCHTREPKWVDGLTPMEQYLNVKGYAKAVKNKRCILINWSVDRGYSVIPTKKIPKQGYIHQNEIELHLGRTVSKGDFAIAVNKALTLSTD